MKIPRSFFIALPCGLLLGAAIYTGLFFLQLGVPTSSQSWLHDVIEMKVKAADAITKPKLLIVAGSSALFGISAAEIEKQTGMPAVNMGANGSLGCAYMLHLAKEVCRPGDTVLLAFEYEAYVFGDISSTGADELFIEYVLSHDREYVRGLDARRQLKLALFTPADRLWTGVRALFRKPKPAASAADLALRLGENLNSRGDQIVTHPEKRPATAPNRSGMSPYLAYGLPDSPTGFLAIREFHKWARAQNVTVLATFPNICQHPAYDLPAAEKAPRQIREFYTTLGIPLLGDAREVMLPEEQMFDTNYHPMPEPSRERTRRLLVHLAPFLKQPPPHR